MLRRMSTVLRLVLAGALAVAFSTAGTSAHFKLLEPASWIAEDQRGDPQKVGPCGGDPKGANEKLLSGVVTKVTGGTKLHLKVQETIYHPGHYRVALAVNSRTELPADPYSAEQWTEKGLYSTWGQIQSPPQLPVLADGLFPHYVRPAAGSPQAVFEADIALPNISCARCTLQVLQYMANHVYNSPGGYSYHHCADLQIVADPGKPIDAAWQRAAGK